MSTAISRLLDIMDTFKTKFPKVGPYAEVCVDYISKVDEDAANVNAADSANKVITKAKQHLSGATCNFHFVGASKLWAQIQRRPPKARPLQFTEAMETPEGRVGLVRLVDYYRFLQDETGDIYERIDSNVRGFQQDTPVNLSIRKTLKTPSEAEFWLLNNGITILAAKLNTAGFKSVTIEDPQIVNGLQTSREIFAYYDGLTAAVPDTDNRRLLVRVIHTTNSAVREDIVRATNSQNRIPPAALRATDRIHGYIETPFRSNVYITTVDQANTKMPANR